MPLPQGHSTVPAYRVLEHACVDFAASLSESFERPSRWVPPERTLPTAPLTMLLADLGPFLSLRGQANSGELFSWFAFSCLHALMLSEPLFPLALWFARSLWMGVDEHFPDFSHCAFIAVTRAIQSHSQGGTWQVQSTVLGCCRGLLSQELGNAKGEAPPARALLQRVLGRKGETLRLRRPWAGEALLTFQSRWRGFPQGQGPGNFQWRD